METITPQRMDILRKQLGIDKLRDIVAEGIQDVKTLADPLMNKLVPNHQFERECQERLMQFDQLCIDGKLVEAYRYGHGAIRSGQESIEQANALQAECINAIHGTVDARQQSIHAIREQIADDIQELPYDIRESIGKEALDADSPLYRAERESVAQILLQTAGIYNDTRLGYFKHDLTKVESEAQEQGIALPAPADIAPLEPLPPFKEDSASLRQGYASTQRHGPSL
jgi:hypothetical protein